MSWEMEGSWKRWCSVEKAPLCPRMLQYWVVIIIFPFKAPIIRPITLFNDKISLFFFSYTVRYSGYIEYSTQPFETNTHLRYPRMMKLGRG